MPILRIIAAILLPPLAVFPGHGFTRPFWIAVGLTMIGFLPGVAFALYTVVRDHRGERPVTT